MQLIARLFFFGGGGGGPSIMLFEGGFDCLK